MKRYIDLYVSFVNNMAFLADIATDEMGQSKAAILEVRKFGHQKFNEHCIMYK